MPTTRDLHTHRSAELNPNDDVDRSITHIAVGDDGTAKSVTDGALDSQLDRVAVVESEQTNTELSVRAFIDSSQLNGETIREAGAASAASGGRLFALEALPDADTVTKDDSKTVTIEIAIDSVDESEV